MPQKKIIIIGSGIAGLAVATRLVVQGFSVEVYEKNATPGGKLGLLQKDGYRFDTGPSLFTQPHHIEEMFELAKEEISSYFSYKALPVTCQYFFSNGKKITAYSDAKLLGKELKNVLQEKENKLANYLYNSGKIYRKIASVFLNNSLHKKATWFHPRIIKAISALRPAFLLRTLNAYNSKTFKSQEAIQLFNRYATYNGSNPYKAPAMLSVIPHLEFNEGIWYPKGGMISIASGLYNLAIKKGVQFHFNKSVDRIIYTEGKIHGIVINDQNIFADAVVSNADIYFTYKNLLQHFPKAKRLLKQERSSSALIFYWGISKKFDQLQLHNIFFSKDYKKEFQYIFDKKELQPDPTVYVNITSKEEENHAPVDCENWFVMINVAANIGQDWSIIKEKARQLIINKINENLGVEIDSLIVTEELLDPVGIEENTSSFMGSLYGTSSNSRLSAFFRHPNYSSDIKNLYFCGGSVHPGGGIPLCMQSAKITADLISKNKNLRITH